MNIPEHPTWSIHDSSKIDTYLTCPRKYFYEYILGWRSDRPAQDLHFGQAWHLAREVQLLEGYDKVEKAYLRALTYYREQFPEETDDLYRPKDMICLGIALGEFANRYKNDLRDNELLFTETSGTVPINLQGRKLHYRMDSILRNKQTGKIFSWDHKSAKKFGRYWKDKFYLSMQNCTYTHCLYCMYPIEEVLGIEFCGTAFEYLQRGSKSRSAGYHVSFERVPAFRNQSQMNVWLWNVNRICDEIENDFNCLMSSKESDQVLMAFPMNPTSCTDFWGCTWHDFCMTWENPLRRCQEPPIGFHSEWWNPEELETTNKMNLEWR